jgi:excinuclease ABC subunit B
VNAKVMLYADRVTESMRRAIEETARRRDLQQAYNEKHGITPETIRKVIRAGIEADAEAHAEANRAVGRNDETEYITAEYLSELEAEMLAAADALEFERAAALRDRIEQMKNGLGKKRSDVEVESATREKRGKRRGRGKGGAQIPRPKRP